MSILKYSMPEKKMGALNIRRVELTVCNFHGNQVYYMQTQ